MTKVDDYLEKFNSSYLPDDLDKRDEMWAHLTPQEQREVARRIDNDQFE